MGDFQYKADELGGKAKEAAGKATDNKDLENEGKGDQVKADIKQGFEDAKDKVTEGLGKLKGDN
ncbi:CsbD family protein [Corynebacterium hansenii]|uniref:CsbD family protein n=1 Tax=Corynebacterium hansenii TaxID=394964 RepID=A0ABV7ZNN2_9CORY|nr:CsbD family protein [Corynebacterium hansenii]WJY98795.1 CsbD-like protein [Corynebacterium hansenii]